MRTKFILLIAIFLISLTGCKKATYLKSETSELTIPISGQCDTVILQSDVNDFKLDSVPEWVQTELTDSVLVITVGNNDVKTRRKGNIVITNGDLKLSIPVMQQYKATYLNLLEGKTLKLGKEGGTASIPVDCDGAISIENGEDLNLNVKDGKLTVTGPKNDEKTVKKKVKLVADEFSEEVEVILEGSLCPRCNGKGKITCPKCGGNTLIMVPHINGYLLTRPCDRCGDGFSGTSSGKVKCPECKGTGK